MQIIIAFSLSLYDAQLSGECRVFIQPNSSPVHYTTSRSLSPLDRPVELRNPNASERELWLIRPSPPLLSARPIAAPRSLLAVAPVA